MVTDGAITRPLRADARRNHDRIVAAAHLVFAEAGPEASLNEIARRADVGPGTLYRRFPTRRALLTAVLEDRIAVLCARADELLTSASPDDALAGWLHAFLAHARDNQGLGSALMLEESGEPGVDCHQRIIDAATALLTNAQRAGSARPDLASRDLIQLVVGIALATARGDDADQPDRLLALVLDTIPRAQGRSSRADNTSRTGSGGSQVT
jgi:AcrR family transcriptional regulator